MPCVLFILIAFLLLGSQKCLFKASIFALSGKYIYYMLRLRQVNGVNENNRQQIMSLRFCLTFD